MTGYQRDSAKIMAACAVINVILNGVLITLYGSTGAAVATATSTVIWNIAAAIVVWYRLGIGSIAFWKFKLVPPFERE
jgi:O-antigen/teichoic acid export membrane protein